MSFCNFPTSRRYKKEIKCKCCDKCSEYCIEIPLNIIIARASLNGSQTITSTPSPILFNNVSANFTGSNQKRYRRKCNRRNCDRRNCDCCNDDEDSCSYNGYRSNCNPYQSNYGNQCAIPGWGMQNCYALYNPSNGTALVPRNGTGHYVIAFEGSVDVNAIDPVTFDIRVNNTSVSSTTFDPTVTSTVRLFHFVDLCPGNFAQILVSGTSGNVISVTNFHIARIY
jgi:hypothetical protein